ncbi:Putative ABC-type transport system involved in lysophospholipase L1 biosynthesis, ATPase component [Idiomarina sp. A28L]|uniref:ABC transporter ATP-binding protein n=1 Tax=Idiomarina sp. A28L TaxID=1036674 RepID=UPI0002138C53|nr:ATP-binding cassette domain-containing protein [Idiomarina sp. A28L]EGN74376.1 Putative ABC-type transport system involved in lysophospholipase L1 biosynthesis, ATPase component [Idiomarina sp. A28L]
MALIEASSVSRNVATTAGELQILSPLSLAINAGEVVAIVGTSGSGKSTLLSLLAGLDLPSTGDITIDNVKLNDLDEEQRAILRGEKIGFIFQSFLLIQSLTALENVMLPAELAGSRNAEKQARELLDKVGLSDRLTHYPNQLSGGEQQRVAIARAFIGQPQILFADEPTGNLDSVTGGKVEALLFELNREYGTTLVMVTHDDKLAERCDRILRLSAGELLESNNG